MTNIDVDGENPRSGLMALIVTVIELLIEAMEREAVRRMEGDTLSDEEIDRLGTQLSRLESEIEGIKRDEGIEEDVERLRGDLDSIVDDAIRAFDVDREPIEREQGSASIDREQGSAPIDQEQGSAPIDQEQGSASIDQEQGSAPIDREQGSAPIEGGDDP